MKKKSLSVKKITHKLITLHFKNYKILKLFKKFEVSLNKINNYAVAVSGGPDSLSLAYLAKCYSILNKVNIKFYLVDHKLRKDSTQEAKKVFLKLKRFGINCKILTWKGKKPSSNIQSIARNKRYSLLTNQCSKDKINFLLLGHHRDDLYENFFIRLLRGSGLKGLTSFGKQSEFKKNGIDILRPLIDYEKKDLEYLSQKIFNFYINDPSNLNENFRRIMIRNLIYKLKKEGLNLDKLKLTLNNLKDSDKSINFYTKKNIETNATFLKKKDTIILKKTFFEQPHEVVFRSISLILKSMSKNYYSARGKNIESLILKINSNKSLKITLGGCKIEKINETVLIFKENKSKHKIL